MLGEKDILSAGILVVDDQPANVRLLEGMLRIAGYTCVESTIHPSEVCELYRKNRYSLILLDLQMPHLDGFQVMEGLKLIEEDSYLPVIVITAQPNEKLRALQAGAKDFVSKPFDLAELRARVHNALEVRLLHRQAKETVRELKASREVIRLKTIAEREQNERELALAQQTQESLLPHFIPQFENFQIHAFSSPTRYVGGDFYDFLQLPSGEWMGVLADVSGKGIPAALLSSMVLGALNMEFHAGTQPDLALSRVNRLLCEKSLPGQFVTLFLFLLNPEGSGRFLSAGQNPVYLFRSASGKIETLASNAFMVGLFESASYECQPFHLNKGDILVVYSDGLTDAQNHHEEMFGEDRLLNLMRQEASFGSKVLDQRLLQAVGDFTNGTPQNDDVTFVIVQYQ